MQTVDKRTNLTRTGVLLLLLALAVLFSGCGLAGEESAGDQAPGSERSGGPPAGGRPGGGRPGGGRPGGPAQAVAVAEQGERSRTIQVAGRLRPRVRIGHDAPVAGVIREIFVEPGQRVEPGAPLFAVERDAVGQTFRPVPVESRIDGVVSQVHVQLEEEIGQGSPGVTVVSAEDYILEARISDKDATDIVVGQAVVGQTASGEAVEGRLTERAQEPDYETGLFTLTFQFDQAPGVSIGTFLAIELPTRAIPGIFVPREAIDRRYGRYFLWVIDEEAGELTRREVTLAESVGEEVEVEGIRPGERYLTSLSGREREGAPAPGTDQQGDAPGREG